jgi:hypothetical protein
MTTRPRDVAATPVPSAKGQQALVQIRQERDERLRTTPIAGDMANAFREMAEKLRVAAQENPGDAGVLLGEAKQFEKSARRNDAQHGKDLFD